MQSLSIDITIKMPIDDRLEVINNLREAARSGELTLPELLALVGTKASKVITAIQGVDSTVAHPAMHQPHLPPDSITSVRVDAIVKK